ncbi:MAG: GntR family transcriptional regulator [Burkholderiaceae bacterium]|nr:GntR family transcriptional regulator [Burkholderiaceae bacterium]
MTNTRSPVGRKTSKALPKPREESSVERLYLDLRDRAMRYDFRPGTRINEQALGREFGVSRAPLREALNRLVAEGLLTSVMNKGFYRKGISVDEVMDLYQIRIALERRAVFLAIQRATDAELQSVQEYWSSVMSNSAHMSPADYLFADEEFHRRMVATAKNKELSTFLDIVSRRIHIARNIDIEQTVWNAKAFDAHYGVLKYMRERNTEQALACITEHIDMSLNRAVQITREMAAKFFLVDSVSSQEQQRFDRPAELESE